MSEDKASEGARGSLDRDLDSPDRSESEVASFGTLSPPSSASYSPPVNDVESEDDFERDEHRRLHRRYHNIYPATRHITQRRHWGGCTNCRKVGRPCEPPDPNTRTARCESCTIDKRTCDCGKVWLDKDRVEQYHLALARQMTRLEADIAVYGEIPGLLGGPLDKFQDYPDHVVAQHRPKQKTKRQTRRDRSDQDGEPSRPTEPDTARNVRPRLYDSCDRHPLRTEKQPDSLRRGGSSSTHGGRARTDISPASHDEFYAPRTPPTPLDVDILRTSRRLPTAPSSTASVEARFDTRRTTPLSSVSFPRESRSIRVGRKDMPLPDLTVAELTQREHKLHEQLAGLLNQLLTLRRMNVAGTESSQPSLREQILMETLNEVAKLIGLEETNDKIVNAAVTA